MHHARVGGGGTPHHRRVRVAGIHKPVAGGECNLKFLPPNVQEFLHHTRRWSCLFSRAQRDKHGRLLEGGDQGPPTPKPRQVPLICALYKIEVNIDVERIKYVKEVDVIYEGLSSPEELEVGDKLKEVFPAPSPSS